MIQREKPTGNLLYKWFASYMMILPVTLVICSMVYVESIRIIDNYINDSAMNSLRYYSTNIESRLQDMQRLRMELSLNNNCRAVLWKDAGKSYEISSMIEIRNTLSTYKIANSFIDNIFIYFKNQDVILSYSGIYDRENWYDTYLSKYPDGLAELGDILKDDRDCEYRIFTNSGKSVHKIYLASSLYAFDESKVVGKLIISVHEGNISGAVSNASAEQNSVSFAIDKNNNILFKSTDMDLGGIGYQDIVDSSGPTISLNDKEYIINTLDSHISDWEFVSLIPIDLFSNKLSYVRNIAIFSVLLTTVIVLFLSYIFTKRNYKPISHIAGLFGNKYNNESKNEYQYIEKSIRNMMKEKEEISDELSRQEQTLKRFFLTRLMNGSVKSESLALNLCDKYDLDLSRDSYQIILFYVEDVPEDYLKKISTNPDITFLDVVESMIQNVLKNLICSKYGYHVTQIKDILVCLVNSDLENFLSDPHYMHGIAYQCDDLLKSGNIELSIAISNYYKGIMNIKTCYQETLEVVEYIKLLGIKQILDYGQISKKQGSDYTYANNRLKNFIITNNFNEAKKELDMIFEQVIKETSSLQVLKLKIFGFMDIMLSTLNEIKISSHYDLLDELNFSDTLLSCTSATELKEQADSILSQISAIVNSGEIKQKQNLCKKVKNYIDKNYTNKELSVSLIADTVKVSPSYLSRIFKKETGLGLSEYIQQVRLSKAKELLTNKRHMPLNDIADQSGFYNIIALIRIFKKYEGITPGKFRK